MTRRSSRAPKLKEAKVVEGSSPHTARQLDFSTKVEPVIKTYTKKVFSEPLTFGDSEESTGSKVILP
jgi:hypothetical protein